MISMSLFSILLLVVDIIYTIKKHSTKKIERQRAKNREKARRKEEDITNHYQMYSNGKLHNYSPIDMSGMRPVEEDTLIAKD